MVLLKDPIKGGQVNGEGCKEVEELKGKNKVTRPGLIRSPKQVWKAKKCICVSGISISTSSLFMPTPIPALIVSKVARTFSQVIGDSSSGGSEMVLSSKVEDGEIMLRDDAKEVSCDGEFNPFVSLASLVNGGLLMESVP